MLDQLNVLMTPAPLAFIGAIATARFAPLPSLPATFAKALSAYLMLVIGLKGGVELGAVGLESRIALHMVGAVLLGTALAFLGYGLLRVMTKKLSPVDVAALAAHYGSVSVVTFVAATVFLASRDVPYEAHLVAMLAVMEAPAIVVGIWLGQRHLGHASLRGPLVEALANRSVLFLAGGMMLGYVLQSVQFPDAVQVAREPFYFLLVIFLVDMGLRVGRQMGDLVASGPSLLAFAIMMPVIGGSLGALTGVGLGLSTGGATLLAVLAGSASYIAAPAAVRLALPTANPSLYGVLPLGITFPFNLLLGIPLYHVIVQQLTQL